MQFLLAFMLNYVNFNPFVMKQIKGLFTATDCRLSQQLNKNIQGISSKLSQLTVLGNYSLDYLKAAYYESSAMFKLPMFKLLMFKAKQF